MTNLCGSLHQWCYLVSSTTMLNIINLYIVLKLRILNLVLFVLQIENLYSLRPNLFRGNKAMGEIKFRLCIHLLFSIYFQFSYLTGYFKTGYIDTEAWRILNMCYGRKKRYS